MIPWLRRVWPGLALIAVIAALYGPATGRYFTSEDFLLLRLLGERPPWRDVVGTLTAPWLGLTIVKFYRPVATTIFALEGAWFGANPLPFNLVHVAVHLANAFLVGALAHRLQRRFLAAPPDARASWLAALIFALYPLHPNAVLFAASFATLFATFFVLATAVLYCRHREEGGRVTLIASMGLFVLALGSYESAVVLAALLVVLEAVAPRAGALRALAPYLALAAAYLALRRAIFGVVIGGYDDVTERLSTASLRVHGENFATSLSQLVLPIFDAPTPLTTSLTILGVALLWPAALSVVSRRRRAASGHARLSLFAAAWVVAFMAPFAFVPVVPANGRYWYMVTIGVGIWLVTLAAWLGAAFPRLRFVGTAVPVAVAMGWAALLSVNVEVNREAGRTARAIQAAVEEAAATDGATRRFLSGYPGFLTNAAGVNLAQVFHYGLWDALSPPFTAGPGIHVYPLPPLAPAAFAPLTTLDGARIYAWTSTGRPLSRQAPPEVARTLTMDGLPDGADPAALSPESTVVVSPSRARRVRLIVLAAGNWAMVERDTGKSGTAALRVPLEFIRAEGHLYPRREILWWVVGEDAAGRIVGTSEVRRLAWR